VLLQELHSSLIYTGLFFINFAICYHLDFVKSCPSDFLPSFFHLVNGASCQALRRKKSCQEFGYAAQHPFLKIFVSFVMSGIVISSLYIFRL